MTDPSAALAAQFGGVPVSTGAPVMAPAAASAGDEGLARQFGGVPVGSTEPAPDFKQTDTSPNEVDPNTIGTFARHVWNGINPLQIGQLLPWPKSLGGSGMDHPLLKVLPEAMKLRDEAAAAWDKGDKTRAAALYLDSLLPIIGPLAHHAASSLEEGKYAAGLGDLAGFVGPLAAGGALPVKSPVAKMGGGWTEAEAATNAARLAADAAKRAGRPAALTPSEQAANDFARENNIPLDAATATGSKAARNAQKRVSNSMGGETTATDLISAQQATLTKAGRSIADTVHPSSVSPEAAGSGVTGSIRQTMADLHEKANESYGTLRKIEAEAPPDTVDLPAAPVDALKDWQKAQLRRVVHEMDASGYVAGKLHETEQGYGSGTQYQRGSGGAKVYQDITDELGYEITRGQMQSEMESYLGGGKETAAVKAALAVVKKRFMGDRSISTPELPASAFDVPTRLEAARESTSQMQMAVDLRGAKEAVRPIYDRLKREAELAPLMGGKADALRALDRLVTGPDHAPLSVADAALGDLKTIARSSDPLLRSAGQGVAAKAVQALSETVDLRAAGAGDQAYDALQSGRAATKAKYAAADVLEQLRTEPVKLFDQMTAQRDGNIGLLRKVAELAPDQMPAVGRAKLESWLDLATERDRFDHADRLYAEWNKLGPETKRILFGKADAVEALDRFFLLAKRIAENPNPSGTAHTLTALNFTSAPVMYGLSKVLYTPRGVKALTRVLELDTKAAAGRTVGRAATSAAWLDLAQAAKSAGVPLELPKAADRGDQ